MGIKNWEEEKKSIGGKDVKILWILRDMAKMIFERIQKMKKSLKNGEILLRKEEKLLKKKYL